MPTDDTTRILESAWAPARRIGALGSVTVPELIDHAAGYVPAASVVLGSDAGDRAVTTVDIGAGVGVPGLLLALLQPAWRMHLVDADERRCDLADAAVTAVGIGDRVTVTHGRADDLGRDELWREQADLVVARSFGSMSEVAECGLPLARTGGGLVLSTTVGGTTGWARAALGPIASEFAGGHASAVGRYIAIRRLGSIDARFPRRPAARRRSPLLGS